MYGIGHVLFKIVFHETPKSFMTQSFRADYMIKLDTTYKSHETKFQSVVWALAGKKERKKKKRKICLSRKWKKYVPFV